LYSVERLLNDEIQSWSEVYCDQLGELIFGDAASEWTAPMVEVYVGLIGVGYWVPEDEQ
jgi:hypothetical protein